MAGRLDPHNHGVSFSNMEAILQTIQDETEVEWKEIFDGFVVSGTFDQIKRVHELLHDHLQTTKRHKKECTQINSIRPIVRDSSTIRQSMHMVGSNPCAGASSFRTQTDSMRTIDDVEEQKYNKPLTSQKSRVKGNKNFGKPSLAESNFQEKFPMSESEKANKLSQPDVTRDASRLPQAKVTHISSTRNTNGKTQDQKVTEAESDSKYRPTEISPSVKKQMVFSDDNKEKSSKDRHLKTGVVADTLPPSRVSEIRNTSTPDKIIPDRKESEQNGEAKDRQLALYTSKGKTDRKCFAAAMPNENESCEDVQSESTLFNENCTAEKSSSISPNEACAQENHVCSDDERPISAECIEKTESLSTEKGKYTMEGTYMNYITPTGIKVMLLKGDITDQDVDVLLSPANPTLSRKEGLPKLIFEKGGQDIEDECLDITQTEGQLEYGTTRFTSSGKLPCRAVLHAVLPLWINENGNERDCKIQIHRCLKSGLLVASGRRHRSVAFPPLGQSWNCIPLEVSTEVITRVIAAFSINVGPMHSGINDFRIVCEDDTTIDDFVKEFTAFSFHGEKLFFSSTSNNKLNDHVDQTTKYQATGSHPNIGCERDVDSPFAKEGSVEQMQKPTSSSGSDSLVDKESARIHFGLPKIAPATPSKDKSHSSESQAILPSINGQNDDLTSNNTKQLYESAVTCISSSCIESIEILERKALEIPEVTGTTAIGLEEQTSKRITSQDSTNRELVEEVNLNPNKEDSIVSSELTEEKSAPNNAKLTRPEILKSKPLHSPAHNEQNEDILSSEAHSSQDNAKDTTSLHSLPDGKETSDVSSSNSALLKIDGGLFVTSPTVEFLLNADLSLGLQGLQIEHERRRNINSKENDDKGKGNFLSFQQKNVNSDETSSIVSCNPTSNENHSNQVTENHPKQDRQDINENLVSSMATAAADAGHNKESNQKCDSKETKDTKDELEPDVVVGDNHYGNKRKGNKKRTCIRVKEIV